MKNSKLSFGVALIAIAPLLAVKEHSILVEEAGKEMSYMELEAPEKVYTHSAKAEQDYRTLVLDESVLTPSSMSEDNSVLLV